MLQHLIAHYWHIIASTFLEGEKMFRHCICSTAAGIEAHTISGGGIVGVTEQLIVAEQRHRW